MSQNETKADGIKEAIYTYMDAAGVPRSEFDAEFVVKMVSAMMVSYFKYGLLAQAYPDRFDATSDVRTRMKEYRESGNKSFLVDAANFAMIEAIHPQPKYNADWGDNNAENSPGRNAIAGRKLVQEDNDGNHILGERILRDNP